MSSYIISMEYGNICIQLLSLGRYREILMNKELAEPRQRSQGLDGRKERKSFQRSN